MKGFRAEYFYYIGFAFIIFIVLMNPPKYYYYFRSGSKLIWYNKKKIRVGFIYIIGIYFAAYAFTSQRYENRLDKIEYKYNIFTTQISAGVPFNNDRLLSILNAKIPVKPIVWNLKTVAYSFCYNRNNKNTKFFDSFFKSYEDSNGNPYVNSRDFQRDIIKQWSQKIQRSVINNNKIIGINLYNADLQGLDFSDGNLNFANLHDANLRDSNLQNAKFKGASLRNADLSGAILFDAYFVNADLRGAMFNGTKLGGVNFNHADLRYAKLQGENLFKIDLSSADLRGVNLQWANLCAADLSFTKLQGVDLQNANLRSADLEGADLKGAKLEGAILHEVNLLGIKNLTAKQLISARNIYKMQNIPQLIKDEMKKLGYEKMLIYDLEKWNEEFDLYFEEARIRTRK